MFEVRFLTPRKKLQSLSSNSIDSPNKTAMVPPNDESATIITANSGTVFENGTIIGAVIDHHNSPNPKTAGKDVIIPEIVISAGHSSNSLHQSRCDIGNSTSTANSEENAAESTALLEVQSDADMLQQDDYEEFMLNRTTSDSNILESSIYSELHFPPSISSSCGSGGPTAQQPAPQTPTNAATVVDLLNTSACSRESRQGKRTRRKLKTKSKCNTTTVPRGTPVLGGSYPPQYTTIYLEPHHHHGTGAANAMGQIASAAASSPFLNTPVPDATNYLHQQYQYYQQRPLISSLSTLGHHHHHRPLLDTAVSHGQIDGPAPGSTVGSSALTTPTSALTPPMRLSFRKWFSRPSLPFVIGILALGGVACTLGGIVLGSTGLIEHSTQYLSAALLMIGIGVSLLVISGAIWRLSLPDETDECLCYRHMETCRNCNSPYCNNRLVPGNYLYPEFQHRPPPPSYLTSLNECAAMGLLFHPAAQAQQAAYSTLRLNTPPPLYRSTNSLRYDVFVPGCHGAPNGPISNGTIPTSTVPGLPSLPTSGGILPDHGALAMSAVMENLQAQTQPFTKEINYLELD